MKAPASYRGTAVVSGKLEALTERLDPQRWKAAFPAIWADSYFATPQCFAQPIAPSKATPGIKGSPSVKEPTDAIKARSVNPPKSVLPERQGLSGGAGTATKHSIPPTGDSLFFEEARFGGYSYRNILRVNCKRSKDAASFTYSQHACLDTSRDGLTFEGGIDVDWGIAHVKKMKGPGSKVKVTVEKKVRFTKPAFLVDELNELAHVFVPLSLDSWIHGLIFSTRTEEEDNG